MDFIGVSSSCINLREDPEILFVCLKKKIKKMSAVHCLLDSFSHFTCQVSLTAGLR